MKNSLVGIAVSFLLLLGWAPPGNASPATVTALASPAVSELLPATLGLPRPVEKTCRVVPPVAGDDYITTAKNTSVTFSPLVNDTDTPDQDFWGFSQPQHGTVVQVGIDGVKYTPNAGYVGSDSFTYTLGGCLQCSGSGFSAWCSEPESDIGTVYLTVTN